MNAPKLKVPRHIAIIMDGNGRWAQQRGLPRFAGHREGAIRVKEVITACGELGIEALTVFAFSTENWKRPKLEVQMLLKFLDDFIAREMPGFMRRNMRFRMIGSEDGIPGKLLRRIRQAEEKTAANTGLTVVLAFNYGARQEILQACRSIAERVRKGELGVDEISEQAFSDCLYTAGIPDPDLLIRTSGELRISNFLLWQLSYAEMYFPKTNWPDFKRKELEEAIAEFGRRQRRYGAIG
jgi:undecaprenyl diphosphate synthase